jgi:hypothetical protein
MNDAISGRPYKVLENSGIAAAMAGSRYIPLEGAWDIQISIKKGWSGYPSHADYTFGGRKEWEANLAAFPGTQNLVLKYQRDVPDRNRQVGGS